MSTAPFLITKFRGTGQTECEVFQNINSTLISLFKYGDATLVTTAIPNTEFAGLAARWRGFIYAISPQDGIYRNTPPSTTATLVHSFTLPNTTSEITLGWHVVWKKNKMNLFTMFYTTTLDWRMVFIDEEGIVTETAPIPHELASPLNIKHGMSRGIYFGNKIFTSGEGTDVGEIQIINPESEDIQGIFYPSTGFIMVQSDIAIHNGKLYGYSVHAATTVGKGNVLWNISSAIPSVELEWEAYQANSNEFPGAYGHCCIFSDGVDLIVIGYSDGTTLNEIGMWRIDFDGGGNVTGKTDIIDIVLGFRAVPDDEVFRCFVNRDIESELGTIKTQLHLSLPLFAPFQIAEGRGPFHSYQWNGASSPATYIGVWGDSLLFDLPHDRIGGARTFTDADELNFTITNVVHSGIYADVTYILDGVAPASGVAMCIKYNNDKDSPLSVATVVPVVNGVTDGNYIAELSTGESGVFRWNLEADAIDAGDFPNTSAFLIRTL